jgi:hypothetical protein
MQQYIHCHTCGTLSAAGQYYCTRCGQPLQQNIQFAQTIYKSGSDPIKAGGNYFQCYSCGAQNVVGVPACSNCHAGFHYTCPHCNTWVNGAFITCPTCLIPLNWPAQKFYTQETLYAQGQTRYSEANKPQKRGVLSTILLVLFAGAVLIIGFDLITNSSNSSASSVHSTSDAANASNAPQTHSTTSATQTPVSAITLSPAPNTTPTPASATSITSAAPLVSQDGLIVEFSIPESVVNSSTSSGSSSTSTSSYLQQLWPSWGHCNKGSCKQTCGY